MWGGLGGAPRLLYPSTLSREGIDAMRSDGIKGGLLLVVVGLVVTVASTVPPTGLLAGLLVGPFLVLLGLVGIVAALRARA